MIEALGMKWRLRTPWHPQSSGRVERMNKTIKNVLTKLVTETQMNWLRCLPLALLRIRARPRSDIRVSPYEMMFGLPFLITPYSTGIYSEGEAATQKYSKTIGSTLEDLRKKGYLLQMSPLDTKLHNINPGDWVLAKSWNVALLISKFEGPFQVLLTTNTAIRTQEKGWSHITRVKRPVSSLTERPKPIAAESSNAWTVTRYPDCLKLTLWKKFKSIL